MMRHGKGRLAYASQGSRGTITVRYRTDEKDLFKQAIGAFTAETGIGVNYVTQPDDYLADQQQMTTTLAGGDTELDTFFCDDIEAAMYGAAGWLEPLNPIVEEYQIDLADWPQTVLTDVSSWDGTLYRLPWSSDIQLFFYRTDWFEEAGLKPPEDWAGIVEVAKQLTEGDRFGIALTGTRNGELGNDIQHWANQAGGAIDRLDHPGSREALIYYKDLFATHKVAPPTVPEQGGGEILQGFLDNKYAMFWVWDGFLGAMRDDKEFWKGQVGAFVPLPKGPENAETSIGAWGWAISAYSTKKDLAKEWIEFSSRPEVMKLQMLRGNAPARLSLWADKEYQDLAPQLVFLSQLAEAGAPFQARPISPGVQAVYDAAEENIHAYITDQIDVDTAIERAMEKINPIREAYPQQQSGQG